jgi:Spx/MgsR family transcriptional regulator
MELYGLKTCDTCRKALKSLEAAGQSVRFVDVRAEPLGADRLAEFLGAFGDALVNTRSTTWRGLSEEERKGAPADLLAAHPALMKRPVLRAEDGTLYLGWGKEVQAALI